MILTGPHKFLLSGKTQSNAQVRYLSATVFLQIFKCKTCETNSF